MRHIMLPIAAATSLLLLSACNKNDDNAMSPEATAPVEQTAPADTMSEPTTAPPADGTMSPPPTDDTMPPANDDTMPTDTTMPPPVDTPADPANPDAATGSTAPPEG
jgi:hypothetical protein